MKKKKIFQIILDILGYASIWFLGFMMKEVIDSEISIWYKFGLLYILICQFVTLFLAIYFEDIQYRKEMEQLAHR